MRIAVATSGADLDVGIVTRLGTCAYLLIINSETLGFEVFPRPSELQGRGAGIATVILAVNQDVDVILARYVSPRMAQTLRENGIEIVSGLKGTAREAVGEYLQGSRIAPPDPDRPAIRAMGRSVRQFVAMLPVLLGVVLLTGLFKVFVSREVLTSIFSGRPITDTLWGACFGSLVAGNPVNSYVIGGALLDAAVSLFAVTAMMITWVTVGLIQLPAELSAFGGRFAVARNAVAFAVAVPIAFLTVVLVRWLS